MNADTIDDTVPPALDWRRMPLQGRVLIEASAGTGKTWNIGLIYLRLLLERGLRAEQILVTTFTDAAAQELRERLRQRLVEAEHVLESEAIDSDDPLTDWINTLYAEPDARRHALRRIQLARSELDHAPVSTIHALCQRIQRDYPLESGAGFGGDKLFDESMLQRECVEDFWRRRYLEGKVDPREAALLLKAGPEGLLCDLGSLANQADARIIAGGLAELEQQLAGLQNDITIARLQQLADDKSLYAPRKKALSTRLNQIADALRDQPPGSPALEAALKKPLDHNFDTEKLAEQEATDKAGALSGHPLIQSLQTLRALMQQRTNFTRGEVLAEAARFCRDELPRRARQRHVFTYGMLIESVYQRLCGEHADAVLADRLYETFPVALIDEFQDTDQRQFAIFDRIYRKRGSMVMIGDPKQAIYSFRGGDIAAYLQAGKQADHRYSLGSNHRSARALVEALNTFYGHTEGGFDHQQIRYQQVDAAARADDRPYTINGKLETQPFVLHTFRGDAQKNGEPLKALGELEALALNDCANRIAELLTDPHRQIDGKPVTPGDIAVLLSTNTQIVALRERLVTRGVPCIGSGRGSIFGGEMARELALLMFAVLHPDDDQAVRGALATRLLGATLEQFRQWQAQPADFERELERFEHWRALVRTRGVLALIDAVLADRAARLLALPEGERLLTDLRHLGELLAAEEASRQGLDGLYVWLQTMRQEEGDGNADAADERQLRIESDARRVQLLTIHASKGLEYPIVFLPLAWRISSRSGLHAPTLLRYHDKKGNRCVDLGSPDFAEHRALHFREELEERLRLLYVALTRAIHAVHVYWVDRGPLPEGDDHAWEWSAIDLLLQQVRQSLKLPPGEDALPALADKLGGIRVTKPFGDRVAAYRPPVEPPAPRAVQSPLPALRAPQWLHSFSGLTRYAEAVVVINDDGDEPPEVPANLPPSAEDSRLLSLYPLRGPRFGDAVHHVLELAAPGPVWPAQRQLLSRQMAAQALKLQGLAWDEALERVGRMIDRVRQTDLGDGLRLADIATDQRVVEFEFQFPVQQVSPARLRQLCAEHGEPEVIPASLDGNTLNGMLTGFADLIIARDGRFHVLDYKTNWLGAHLDDYQGASLDQAMAEHHYPLQALLYTVALHRYLGQRMDGYTAEHHLGDSRYLFVRALGLAPGLGVWRHRWPAALIEALDQAFAGHLEHAA